MNKFQAVHEYVNLAERGVTEPFECSLCGGEVVVIIVPNDEDPTPGLWCPADDSIEEFGAGDIEKIHSVIKQVEELEL